MIDSPDFTLTILTDRTPAEVFAAINDVRAWWTGDIEGSSDRVGAEFTYRYKALHRSKQRVTALVPAKRVAWHVIESSLTFTEKKNEWDGTDVVFEIEPKGAQTEIRFTHRGLAPKCECYDACSKGWTFYVGESLRDLLTKRKGLAAAQARA